MQVRSGLIAVPCCDVLLNNTVLQRPAKPPSAVVPRLQLYGTGAFAFFPSASISWRHSGPNDALSAASPSAASNHVALFALPRTLFHLRYNESIKFLQ